MANTRETPAKPSDFGTDIVLGTADDTKAVETVLQRVAVQSAKLPLPPPGQEGPYFWVDLRVGDGTPLYCEDTVNWPGTETGPAKNLAAMFDTESRALGYDKATGNLIPADQADALGNARSMVCRNRAHWRVDWAKHCKMTAYTVKGPHSDAYRGRSIASVLEQQCGLWINSTDDMDVCAGTITEVWGDSISCHSVKPYGKTNDRIHIWANTFDRNGRECVLLTAAGAADCHDNTILRHTSQIFHSESGQGLSNPPWQGPWLLHNNAVMDTPGDGKGYFLHCTGGSAITEIWIQANVVKGQALQVFVDPAREMPDPTQEKIKQLWVIDNTWNRQPAGGYLLNARDITEVHYKRNKGYCRKISGADKGIHTERCDVVDIDSTLVLRPA